MLPINNMGKAPAKLGASSLGRGATAGVEDDALPLLYARGHRGLKIDGGPVDSRVVISRERRSVSA